MSKASKNAVDMTEPIAVVSPRSRETFPHPTGARWRSSGTSARTRWRRIAHAMQYRDTNAAAVTLAERIG
jgi:hypothetical protein